MTPISYAYIETTNHCNLNCSFCNRSDVIGPLKHMSLQEFEKLMRHLKTQPITDAKLMGMGEPFLHPQFDEICRTFKTYFPASNLISATNCQYTPGKVFNAAIKYIDVLYLSIDGYKTNYEKYRSPSKWAKLIKFLDSVVSLDRRACKFVINYVVNPDNVDDIQLVYDNIFKAYLLDDFRLNIAQAWTPGESIPRGYTDTQYDYLKNNWSSHIKGKANWDFKDCFWVKNGLYVTVDGRVLMCCMNTAEPGFGNIFEQPLQLIKQSTKFNSVVNGCLSNTPSAHCNTCSYKELAPILTRLGVAT